MVFLARFFGLSVAAERLRDSLAGDNREQLEEALDAAGLVGTILPPQSLRRASERPDLVLGEDDRVAAVLLKQGSGATAPHLSRTRLFVR